MTCHFSPFLILTFLSLFSLLYFSYPFIFREGLLKEEKELTSRVESGAADPEESTRLTEVFQSLEAIDSAKAPARAAVILSGIATLPGYHNISLSHYINTSINQYLNIFITLYIFQVLHNLFKTHPFTQSFDHQVLGSQQPSRQQQRKLSAEVGK